VLTGRAAAAADAAAQAAQAFIRDGGQEVHVARLLETCLSEVDKGETDAALRSLDGVLSRSGVNPELYRPSTEALDAIRALIRAGSEVPAEHP